ncbi:MAG: hypothetical protein HFG40_01715 [Bacilli bacterium]|nr:hypothetical protein [Bacilli bacterium]
MSKNVVKFLLFIFFIFSSTGCFFRNTPRDSQFDDMNLGIYTWKDSKNASSMTFELGKSGDKYYYVLEFYYDNSLEPTEELWGVWNVTRSKFIPSNDNVNSYAQYEFKDIQYHDEVISFEILIDKVLNSKYQEKAIPSGKYQLTKYES